jgi:hypothetical protein
MWELLAVLGVYLVVSFIGMAALWTVAAGKSLVRAPSYFFWMRADKAPMPSVCESSDSNAVLNLRPFGLTVAAVVFLHAVLTSQPPRGWVGEMNSNQTACPNGVMS